MTRPRTTLDGAKFILDAPKKIPAIWGSGQRVAWSEGEPLLIVGPSGVGKTTLCQQLVLRRLGLREPDLLDLPVAAERRKVLYIAADRPAQAQRSFQRMCSEEDRAVLAERLVVWRGPLPFDIVTRPEALAQFAASQDAGTIAADSLKDIALDLSKDDVGARVNAAFQHAVADGIEFVGLHHQRKQSPGAPPPRTLADVYGSTWITAGAGSVVLLWGEPGDLLVDLRHLKQPSEEIGPYTILHDHDAGLPIVQQGVDLYELMLRTVGGLTVLAGAQALFDVAKPTRNHVEKTRRKLERLVAAGHALKTVTAVGEPAAYRAIRQTEMFG